MYSYSAYCVLFPTFTANACRADPMSCPLNSVFGAIPNATLRSSM